MPLYKYQCYECGLQFKVRVTRSRSSTQPCKSCGGEAKRSLPTSLNHGFEVETEGLSQPNTGISSVDYDFDHVIHSDSNKKWRLIDRRQQAKRELIRGSSTSARNVVRVGDTYGVVGNEERAALDDKVRKMNQS